MSGQQPQDQQTAPPTATDQDYQTPEQVNEELQEEMRRQAATREDLPDSTDRLSVGGTAQGMDTHSTKSGKHS